MRSFLATFNATIQLARAKAIISPPKPVVEFCNSCQTISVRPSSDSNACATLPYSWVLDNDQRESFSASGQRHTVIDPSSSSLIESIGFTTKAQLSSGTVSALKVNWKSGRQSVVPTATLLRETGTTSDDLDSLWTSISEKLATSKTMWKAENLYRAEEDRSCVPSVVEVRNCVTGGSDARAAILKAVEKYGFALGSDAKLLAKGKSVESATKARCVAVEHMISSTFAITRNATLGLMSFYNFPLPQMTHSLKQSRVAHSFRAYQAQRPKLRSSQTLPISEELHTFGTYFFESPKVQCHACVAAENGSVTVKLVDGFAVAERLLQEEPDMFRVLTTIPVPAVYIQDNKCYESCHPVIQVPKSHQIRFARITFSNAERASLRLCKELPSAADLNQFYAAYNRFYTLACDETYQVAFSLSPGELLFVDNHRILQSHTPPVQPCAMTGCVVGSDDYYSSLKVFNH